MRGTTKEMRTGTLITLLTIVLAGAVSCDRRGGLQDDVVTVELTWVGWGCRCPEWCAYQNGKDPEPCIFVEPADPTLELPASLWIDHPSIPRARFTGRYYEGEGRPKGYYTEGVTEGRVLQYTAYEIIR